MSFYNDMMKERSILARKLFVLDTALDIYLGKNANPVKQKLQKKVPNKNASQRKKWLMEFFSKGGEGTTDYIFSSVKREGFKVTKHALRQMLARIPQIYHLNGIWKKL